MKKVFKKGALLFAGAMALCAFATPSMASAASWGMVGSHHTLDSPNFGYTQTSAFGQIIAQCTSSSFTTTVANTQNLEITSGRFGGKCTADLTSIGAICTVTVVGTKFPWTATVPTTRSIQIHDVHIDVRFESAPADTSCGTAGISGADFTITGTLTGGIWTGNGSGQHAVDFSNAEGLVSHNSSLGNNVPVTVRGFLSDTMQTLIATG
jgi:hypothetical protein